MTRPAPTELARALATAWLQGAWTLEGLRQRTRRLLARSSLGHGLEQMVLGFWLELRDRPHLRRQQPLARAILEHRAFAAAPPRSEVCRPVLEPAVMAAPPRAWSLPELPTLPAVARWLGLDDGALTWLSDPADLAVHYRRYWHGTRLIEVPGRRLREVQRRLLDGLLYRVPCHDAAHGFRPGRSVLSAVRPHAGRPVLAVLDLRAFFPTVRSARVHALLQRLGYPESVARVLTRLTTTRCHRLPARAEPLPPDLADRYRGRHLPQGAPASPALANLTAFHLDARLTGLARRFGARYTRYADDLIFSGPRPLARPRFAQLVAASPATRASMSTRRRPAR